MTQTTLREYLRTTEDAISSGRIEEAMANCQNILTYFPEALEAQRLLGEVYLAQGQMEEAQQTFEWILTNDPENVIVYCDRALISERTSDIDTALDCYQQAYELSRGNANIRQEFNQLSARVGQQEFMFSRAGLARLYMRGDLLTQALQEWDAVLAISPDRLDARLGLMETHWREGTYNKAEQVGMQLLEEVPTCLKALLLLAHIASISNVGRARDLLIRAQALDPELTMAQELFADLAASQPNDPFLELLKKEPILLENGRPVIAQTASATRQPSSPVSAPREDTYGNWETLDTWNQPAPASTSNGQQVTENGSRPKWDSGSDDYQTYIPAQPEMPAAWVSQLEQQAPPLQDEPTWYQQNADESWNTDIQETESSSPPAWLDTLTRAEEQQTPTSDSANTFPEALVLQPTAPQPVVNLSHASPAPEIKEQPGPEKTEDDPVPFFFPSEDEGESDMGWPEWLKSLGAETLEPEPQNPSAPLPEIQPALSQPSAEQPALSQPSAEQPVQETPQQEQPLPESDPWASLPSISANNDTWAEVNGQPDWMQQVTPVELPSPPGVAPEWMQQFSPINNSQTQNAQPEWQQFSPINNSQTQNAQPEWMQQFSPIENSPAQERSAAPDWIQQFSPTQSSGSPQNSVPDWMRQMSPAQSQNATPSWMQQLSGSEESFSQEPALPPVNEQEQRYLASLEDLEKSLQSQGFVPMEPGSLSSIAQAQTQIPTQPQQEIQPSLSSALAQLGNFKQPPTVPNNNEAWWTTQSSDPSVPGIPHTPGEVLNPFEALGARGGEEQKNPFTPLPATPKPDVSQNLTPTYRSDALLDSDLETTMKRPAITLQPMRAREGQQERLANGKGRGERKPIEHVDDSNLSHHDRLLRGYQYQLSGAYEESMQEYRLVIRNAPELLEDVISNLRALLKINPRFSLGHRVLGDAYMRKGEYLQAMESYNKALTMAKKAKN